MKSLAAFLALLGSIVVGGLGLYLGIILLESIFVGIIFLFTGLIIGFFPGLILLAKADEKEQKELEEYNKRTTK